MLGGVGVRLSRCMKVALVVVFVSLTSTMSFLSKLHIHCTKAASPRSFVLMSSMKPNDDVFGVEISIQRQYEALRRGKALDPKMQTKTKTPSQIMGSYQKMRINYFSDSLLVSVIGLSLVWSFGTLHDSLSYALGSLMGVVYSLLLGKYVERIGTARENRAVDNLRFAPVVFLVLLYAKYRTTLNIIPELAGFVLSSQLSSFLQMFNDDLYGELEELDED